MFSGVYCGVGAVGVRFCGFGVGWWFDSGIWYFASSVVVGCGEFGFEFRWFLGFERRRCVLL